MPWIERYLHIQLCNVWPQLRATLQLQSQSPYSKYLVNEHPLPCFPIPYLRHQRNTLMLPCFLWYYSLHLSPCSGGPVTSWEIIMPVTQGPKVITKLGMKGCRNANWSAKQPRFSTDILRRECIRAITQLAWFLPAYRIQQRGQSINTTSYYSEWLIWHLVFRAQWKSLHKDLFCGNKASRKEKQSS